MSNLLQFETSPYLLQHAANPVDWMPWGEAAFERARTENKPVLISIGYSSCHWCHVMAHESFEDDETAALMNQHFINIKVDREEYPDVDHLYMDALQAMSGSGGWPLNVFATPDKKPFYGGTYFPPVRAHGRPSWKEVLMNVAAYYSEHRDEVEAQAGKLLDHLATQGGLPSAGGKSPEPGADHAAQCAQLAAGILANADSEEGGFGRAPKFPSSFSVQYLLEHAALTGDKASLEHATLSLDKMMMGGMYDAVGGGFARYSTDNRWIVPHFEKMLYDNALLIETYAIAFAQTRNEAYREVIAQTVDWLQRDMMHPEYGFYSAQDADSEGVEGKYYTWSHDELQEILGEDAAWFCVYYNVREGGNWEHTNILYRTQSGDEGLAEEQRVKLQTLHARLLDVRAKRIAPLTDDKVLLGWNALMNKALVMASLYTGEKRYLDLACRNMRYLLEHFRSEDWLYFHTSRNGRVKIAAYLDDLAFLSEALIYLGMATAETEHLQRACAIVEFLDLHFLDEGENLYQFTHREHRQVGIPKKEIYDGALPSSNAVLASVLSRLSIAFQREDWSQRSRSMMESVMPFLLRYPTSFSRWALHHQRWADPLTEVTFVGEQATEFLEKTYATLLPPNVICFAAREESPVAAFRGKYQAGETLIYVCRNFNCLPPFRDINEAFIEICNPSF